MSGRVLVAVLLALAVAAGMAGTAAASERHPTLAELEGEIMCPTCRPQTLDQSNSPEADRIRAYIRREIAAGATKSEIKADLVKQFGPSILAAPEKKGFGLLAWLLPLVAVGAGALVVGALAWRWSRAREPAPAEPDPRLNGRGTVDPELERRLDDELARFDG